MKKIDKLLVTSFIGPFLVSFGIAVFVLILQFLWVYIDEIAGKGVSLLVLFEMIGYQSVTIFPMALPIAVLIASVMVLGNLAERYELSSMKSAGVSLLRTMYSLIFCCSALAVFSYLCSDYIIPKANIKAKSRLSDIRRQKPALALDKGVFNEDFRQFVIRIGDKESDGETIEQVMIVDQTNAGRLRMNQILADSGLMYTTNDQRYFVMELLKGVQYQEPNQSGAAKQKYPFIRTSFSSMTKVWNMREFEMTSGDEDRFKGNRAMLSMNQLRHNLDSLDKIMAENRTALGEDLLINLQRKPVPPAPATVQEQAKTKEEPKSKNALTKRIAKQTPKPEKESGPDLAVQRAGVNFGSVNTLLETFLPEDIEKLKNEALTKNSSWRSAFETRRHQVTSKRKEWVKTGYELYIKYSFALVCLIFLFIGAPMGAIIRKGGFGYPILVSIFFFVVFMMLTITCRKLAETYIMTPFQAAMMPCVVLTPIGIFLTRKAMNDSQMLNTDRLERFFQKLFARKRNPKVAAN